LIRSTFAGLQLVTNPLNTVVRDRWTAKPDPGCSGALLAGNDPVANECAFEFGKDTKHLKQHLTGWRAGIETLLMQVQVNTFRVQVAQESNQVGQRSAQAANRPSGHDIVFPACNAA
jgi:hypothetical protein